MFKRPGSLAKSAFGVTYRDASRQQQQHQGHGSHEQQQPARKRPRTEQLPAEQVRRELLYLVEQHATVVVVGETGCGKTTQIPRFLHEAGWTADGYQVCVPVCCLFSASTRLSCPACLRRSSRWTHKTLPDVGVSVQDTCQHNGMLQATALLPPHPAPCSSQQ